MKKIHLPLINAHTHAAMVAFRGMAEDVSLQVWLKDYIKPLQKIEVNKNLYLKIPRKL